MNRRRVLAAVLGATLFPPVRALAQQGGRLMRVTLVTIATPGEVAQVRALWVSHFAKRGFLEGRNLALTVVRQFEDSDENFERKAAQVVASRPEVICVPGTKFSLAFQRLTRDIPVVFFGVGDPVRAGLVQSLSRPGGNLTGVMNRSFELLGKRLELLKELKPDLHRVALLSSRDDRTTNFVRDDLAAASKQLRIQMIDVLLPTFPKPETVMKALRDANADAVVYVELYMHDRDWPALFALLRQSRLPTVFNDHATVEDGALVSLEASRAGVIERVVDIAVRIERGEAPATIPVEQASKFHLAINLRTARAMKIRIPQSILIRADQVIE